MLMFGLNTTLGRLAMESSVCWSSHVMRRVDGCVSRWALEFGVEGKR